MGFVFLFGNFGVGFWREDSFDKSKGQGVTKQIKAIR
jgi:hypothetical protein